VRRHILSNSSHAYFSRNVKQKSAGSGMFIFLFFFKGIKWYPIAILPLKSEKPQSFKELGNFILSRGVTIWAKNCM
jgi:hypothetical protein